MAFNHIFTIVYSFWYFRQGPKANPTHLAQSNHARLLANTYTKLSPSRKSWVGEQGLVPISDTMTPTSPPTMLPLHSGPTVTGPSMGSNILRGQGSRDEVMMSPWLLAGG